MYDIKPDLTCLGKIGAGLPVGARRQRDHGACEAFGDVYQAGTLSGNPTLLWLLDLLKLQALCEKPPYEKLTKITDKLVEKISKRHRQFVDRK
ncbi:MAG: hypothetical protein R3C24_05665 [Cyanobacteriota/Melainabacteria group bacterium]